MYYPYLRGKQNELILLRENSKLMSESSMIPIIEPVKKNTAPLNKAIQSLMNDNVEFVLIVNPKYGDFKSNPLPLIENILKVITDYDKYSLAYIVDADSTLLDVKDFLDDYKDNPISFVHNGFPKPKELAELLYSFENIQKHIFMDDKKLYQRQFKKENLERILIRDGFEKKDSNREYPDNESFSELHLTYDDEGMDGFGDFLITGNSYSESGGPAYNVAIHLTYLNEDEIIYIRHFISNILPVPTPKDPAGKFAEALDKLVYAVEEEDSLILKSDAYYKFKELHESGHFPGLGVVKKVSMQHHLELIAKFISDS